MSNPGNELVRSVWSDATVLEQQYEEFNYHEAIIDRQGRAGTHEDIYSRPFDPTRTRRTRR